MTRTEHPRPRAIRRVIAVAAVLLAAASATPGTGLAAASGDPAVQRFIAVLELTFSGPARPGCGDPDLLLVKATGTGRTTATGLVTDHQYHCVDPATGDFTRGRFVLTSVATGDKLAGTYAGTQLPPDESGVSLFSARATLTGGTGEFSGVTGSAIAAGEVDLNAGTALVVLSGRIRR